MSFAVTVAALVKKGLHILFGSGEGEREDLLTMSLREPKKLLLVSLVLDLIEEAAEDARERPRGSGCKEAISTPKFEPEKDIAGRRLASGVFSAQ